MATFEGPIHVFLLLVKRRKKCIPKSPSGTPRGTWAFFFPRNGFPMPYCRANNFLKWNGGKV